MNWQNSILHQLQFSYSPEVIRNSRFSTISGDAAGIFNDTIIQSISVWHKWKHYDSEVDLRQRQLLEINTTHYKIASYSCLLNSETEIRWSAFWTEAISQIISCNVPFYETLRFKYIQSNSNDKLMEQATSFLFPSKKKGHLRLFPADVRSLRENRVCLDRKNEARIRGTFVRESNIQNEPESPYKPLRSRRKFIVNHI